MEENEFCTFYVDYVRECVFHMKSISREMETTLRFCISGNYRQCPFARYINDPSIGCEYFETCAMCEHFKNKDMDGFVELTERWCLGDFSDCKRFQLKKAGQTPGPNLHPLGHEIS